jgi:AcrR family transcriptional regulator
VTRGALYHHFADKRDLLRAVVIDIQQELMDRVVTAFDGAPDPWEGFVAGWFAVIDAADDPALRLLMVDAPAALGAEDWTAIDDEYCYVPAVIGVSDLIARGLVPDQPAEPLARVLLTASNALATYVAGSPDPAGARAEVAPVWRQLLEFVRAAPPPTVPAPSAPGRETPA